MLWYGVFVIWYSVRGLGWEDRCVVCACVVWCIRGVYVCYMVLCNLDLVWLINFIVFDRGVVWCFRRVIGVFVV